MKTVAFFNNKGGVGKTSLVYHLAWMYADLGLSTVAADLDPQANLTSMFLDDDQQEALWERDGQGHTVYDALLPLLEGSGDIRPPFVQQVQAGLTLLIGDLRLSLAEDELSRQWPLCLDKDVRAFRVISALWRILAEAARSADADIVLIDVGPNLGALNRAAMVAASNIAVPLAPDLYSLQGLRNLGPRLEEWREAWAQRLDAAPSSTNDFELPRGEMKPAGYIVLQHAMRLDRPVKAYARWMNRIPGEYRQWVVQDRSPTETTVEDDPHCLTALKHYRSLMPLAQEARKPIFALKVADGVTGGHARAVQSCYGDFHQLAVRIARQCGVTIPDM